MSESPEGPGWWQASDGKWYPPEQAPGYQAGGGGAGGTVDGPFDVGSAITYGWNKFVQYIGQVIVIVLIILAVQFAFIIVRGIINATVGGFIGLIIGLALVVVGYIIGFILQMGLIRMGLLITSGQEPDPGIVFKFDNVGPYAVASILVGIFVFIGFFALCIGALIVAFFTVFYGFYVLDQNQAPMESIISSFNLVKDHIGELLLFLLVVIILNFITCGLASGVTQIATAYAYRKLNGQPVAA